MYWSNVFTQALFVQHTDTILLPSTNCALSSLFMAFIFLTIPLISFEQFIIQLFPSHLVPLSSSAEKSMMKHWSGRLITIAELAAMPLHCHIIQTRWFHMIEDLLVLFSWIQIIPFNRVPQRIRDKYHIQIRKLWIIAKQFLS